MYSKKFDPSRYESIKDVLEKIQDLELGGTLWIRGLSKEQVYNTRWLLYDWLYHMELKRGYRLRVIEGNILIVRLKKLDFSFEVTHKELPERLRSFFEDSMLCHLKEEDAKKALGEVEDEEDRELLFERWKKVMM